MFKMDYYGSTTTGRRKENQDRFLIYHPNEQTLFLAIADGIGGMVGGAIASELVIKASEKIINDVNEKIDGQTDLKAILAEIFSEAQKIIRTRITQEPSLGGMGTTLCCILIFNDHYVWGNIGDSRIYHFTEKGFTRITKDHTQIEEFMSDNNKQFPLEVINTYGHFLTRSINGGNDEPDIYPKDATSQKLKSGEGFLLCSDGLLLNKSSDASDLFYQYLIGTNSLREFLESIIAYAYEKGSTDNITCISLLKGELIRKKNNIIKYNYPLENYFNDV